MFQTVGLLVGTNLAVVVVMGAVMSALVAAGIIPDTGQWLGGYGGLLIMSLVMGFAGSFISLLMSKGGAKRSSGARTIDNPQNEEEQWIVSTVAEIAQKAGIKMPEVAIFDSPVLNAFATGPSKNNSLVAVSTGLMRGMSRDEVEGVLAHEVAHVANGDMVRLTLIQGVTNTFVIFLSQVLGGVLESLLSGREGRRRRGGMLSGLIRMVLQVVLGFLATIIVKWFSRHREFKADLGGAQLSSPAKMRSALERLKSNSEPTMLPQSVEAMGISGFNFGGIKALFATHPPLALRIQRLKAIEAQGVAEWSA